MTNQEAKELKKMATDKISQGDVNYYKLPKAPEVETTAFKGRVVVVGASGNHHSVVGTGVSIRKVDEVRFIVNVTGSNVRITHPQHTPAIKLKKGVYLVDRVLEKGMFSDLIAPVVD